MKSPGVIYRQYRQARKLAFIRALSAARLKKHENCYYASTIHYNDVDGTDKCVRLCLLRPEKMDICTDARDCNAFARRWLDDKVAEEFDRIMSDEVLMKKTFPELWAYEWALDKSLKEAKESKGPLTFLIVSIISFLESVLRAIGGRKRLME
jgi:hypothetical protein